MMPPSIAPDNLLLVGVCGPPHGVKGEVKVIPETDDPERLLDLEKVWLGESAAGAREVAVERARIQRGSRGPVVLMQLESIGDRDAAEAVRRQRVYADATELPPLDDGQLYLHDLRDLQVHALTDDGQSEHVGVVADVIEGVAQDLIVVRRNGQPDVLVPDVDEIVVDVDLEAGTLTLRPPEGLLD